MEFRCFVRNRTLICLSQRQNHYYPFLQALELHILKLATELFEHLKDFESENWVFDMYIPRTRIRGHLIDMNPFAPRTDPGLFEWREILNITGQEGVVVRFVKEEDRGIGGMEFSAQRLPKDVIDASQGTGVVEFAVKWEEMLRKGMQDDEVSDTE
jgi:D123